MVQPIAPLFQWKDGELRSPAEVAREQRVAEALMFAKPQATGFWGALGQVGSAASGSMLDSRADASEQQGREAASALFGGLGSGASTDAIAQALMNPAAAWATPGQQGVAEALLNTGLKQQDPMYQLQLEQAQLELEQMRNPAPQTVDPTAAMQNYQFLVSTGVDPNQAMAMSFGGDGPVVNVNNGQPIPDVGTIPPGYMLRRDETGVPVEMVPIPGSAPATDAAAAAAAAANAAAMEQQGGDIVSTDIGRAINILDTPGMLPTSGFGADWVSSVGGTAGADLRNLLNTVKANVAFDTLSQMRAASPTGGALGAVSERELSLLESAKGALDQSQSPKQLRDNLIRLQNLTLDVIHGKGQGPQRLTPSYETQPTVIDWSEL